MSDIFSAAGSVAGAAISAGATRDAARMQADAIREAQQFLFENLDPAVVQGYATDADVQRTQQRLALQQMIDPSLSALRYQSQDQLLGQGGQIGQGVQEQLAQQAAAEAMSSGAATTDLRTRLIDSALQELELGATLPPDFQAELVQAGLERAGMVQGSASPKGVGGTLVRKALGAGAIQLQADRQQRAAALAQTASGLEGQRQQILQSLFPSIQNQQISNLQATSGLLGVSDSMVPEAGLSGTDIANLWAARVGANAQLTQQAGAVNAAGLLGSAQAWAPAIGQAVGTLGNRAAGWFSAPPAPISTNMGMSYPQGGGSSYSAFF